ETGSSKAGLRVNVLCRARIGRRRIVPESAIKDVAELGADVQSITLLDAERPSKVQVFGRTPLSPVIVVVSGGSSKLTGRRICPGSRVQRERLARIVAFAVEIDCIERLAGAVRKSSGRGSATGNVIEEKRVQRRRSIGKRRLNRQAARILQESAD